MYRKYRVRNYIVEVVTAFVVFSSLGATVMLLWALH